MRRLAKPLCALAVCVLNLGGCVTQPESTEVAQRAASPGVEPVLAPAEITPVDKVAEQQQRLRERQQQRDELLYLAEQALEQDRLMRPAEDNAFMWYQQVIALDELNTQAHWGMRRITRRYLQLAEQAFEDAEPSRAEYLLNSALQVAATPQQVQLIRDKYKDQLKDKVFALPGNDLRIRNDRIQQQLAVIARQAKEESSRLLIVARNDAEGRWIYQQMREAVDGHRLRGNIEVGQHPRVVLIDL